MPRKSAVCPLIYLRTLHPRYTFSRFYTEQIFNYLPRLFPHNAMNRPCSQARRVKDIGLVLREYYSAREDNGTEPQDERGDIQGPRWYRRPFPVYNLSKFLHHSKRFLLLTMDLPRPRALLSEQYRMLTRFSGRTPDTSGVDIPILARPGELYTWYSKLCF